VLCPPREGREACVRRGDRLRNFAPGNAGPILYTDVLIPVFRFALLWRGQMPNSAKRLHRTKLALLLPSIRMTSPKAARRRVFPHGGAAPG
jgi:hypothetical protein